MIKPHYNILSLAGNSLGFKHRLQTINKLKPLFSKKNYPKYGTICSSGTKKAISNGIKKFYLTKFHRNKGKIGKESPQYGLGGKSVFFYNREGENINFPSINAAKQHFRVR